MQYLCIASHFSDQRPSAPVDNRSYVLASHQRLPVHMNLPSSYCGQALVWVPHPFNTQREGVAPRLDWHQLSGLITLRRSKVAWAAQ